MSADKHDIEAFMDLARVKLTGASDAGIKANLYNVFTEFYRDTWQWIEQINFNVIPTQTIYTVSPNGGQIIELVGVVDPINTPQPAVMSTPTQIQLINEPNAQQDTLIFTATVIKNIVRPTGKDMFPIIADDTLRLYPDIVLDGLCARMMMEPNKSYSNSQLALFYRQAFAAGKVTVKVDVMRSRTIGAQNWRYPQQFRMRGQKGGISVGNNTGFV